MRVRAPGLPLRELTSVHLKINLFPAEADDFLPI